MAMMRAEKLAGSSWVTHLHTFLGRRRAGTNGCAAAGRHANLHCNRSKTHNTCLPARPGGDRSIPSSLAWHWVPGKHVRGWKAGSSIHGLAPPATVGGAKQRPPGPGARGCGRWRRRSGGGDTTEAQRVASRRLHHRSVGSHIYSSVATTPDLTQRRRS